MFFSVFIQKREILCVSIDDETLPRRALASAALDGATCYNCWLMATIGGVIYIQSSSSIVRKHQAIG